MTDNRKQFIFMIRTIDSEEPKVFSSYKPFLQQKNRSRDNQYNHYLLPNIEQILKHSSNYDISNHLYLNEGLKAGKNIIYEITNKNVNTIYSLCDFFSEPTEYLFPGSKQYNQNPEYTYEYKIILLLPYSFASIFIMTMNSIFKSEYLNHLGSIQEKINSNVDINYTFLKHIQYVIDHDCIDMLLLYNDSPSRDLTLLFNKKENTRSQLIRNPNIVNDMKIQFGADYYSKGHIADSIYDATDDCYRSLKYLYENRERKEYFNLPGQLNNTFSFFNMGISWISNDKGSDYYLAAVRVIGWPIMDDLSVMLSGFEMTSKEEAIIRTNDSYMNWIDKSLDRHNYVDYAGDIFNKWFSPFGWWKSQFDRTMLLLYKKTNDSMIVIDQCIYNELIDTRIFQTYATNPMYANKNTISIISGSLLEKTIVNFGLDEFDNCIRIPPDYEIGMKQGISSVTIIENSFINPVINKAKMIATCISKIPQTDKNYAMIYFSHNDASRFNPNKGVLLHFHLSRLPHGNIFYYKEVDFDREPNADLGFGWKKIIPPNSDIFLRICDFYTNNTLDNDRYHFGEISCTTPLNTITYLKDQTYITGVAHIKINIWTYLEHFVHKSPYEGDELLAILETDKVFRFYKYSMLPWVKHYIWNSEQNINKYTATLDLEAEYWKTNPLPNYLSCVELRELLHLHGFFRIKQDDGGNQSPQIIRHLHPNYIYFMMIYRLNLHDLSLKDFSNPFIIMNKPESSFLNFPMGLTLNNDNIWISYGEGDCKSYIATFTKKKIDQLCKNTNDTLISDIDFDLYDNL